MSKTLTEIAQQLKDTNKKVQLIYAFNGTGKTRLSREFKQLVASQNDTDEGDDEADLSRQKILYYNAFTEDLFYWDNDLEQGVDPKLKIQPNSFTDWVLKDQGQDRNIITNFQRYSNQNLTPHFSEDFAGVTFTLERGDDTQSGNLKISKGEESNFIWSIFYTLIEQVIAILNVPEPSDRETNEFDQVEYIFIDDPVSSLDENHLIELAVDVSELVKSNQSNVKFIITTHNPLFYNVLHNELSSDNKNLGYKRRSFAKYRLDRNEDGNNELLIQPKESYFSYHLYLKNELEQAISAGVIDKYHFNYLRNILEKTTILLGYERWG